MMGFAGFGGFGFLIMLFFFFVIIGLAVWLVNSLFPRTPESAPPYTSAPGGRSGGHAPPSAESPLDILKRRYARGELTKSEYEAMRDDLSAS